MTGNSHASRIWKGDVLFSLYLHIENSSPFRLLFFILHRGQTGWGRCAGIENESLSMLQVKDLSFRYPENRHLTLDRVSLDIQSGDWVAITGQSGCGKTTLALAISGMLFHQTEGEYRGHVEIDGELLEGMPPVQAANLVYLVQQNPENQFCKMTVYDEIAAHIRLRRHSIDEIEEEIDRVLEIMHCANLKDAGIFDLSDGEKRKIAIAAAFALNPRFIILDEPTANLDPRSSHEIFDALNNMRKKIDTSIVVIEHRLNQILPYEPRILYMSDGKITTREQSARPKLSPNGMKKKKETQRIVHWNPVLYLENLSVKRREKEIVKVNELLIYPGEFIVLAGPSGSGKSTLLQGLTGFLKTSYKIGQLLDCDLRDVKTLGLTRKCGYVFQCPDHQLFCETVEKEVFLAPENFGHDIPAMKSGVMEVMKDFGLNGLLAAHPGQLSYGEKKRLNLASVLAYEPQLLLDDIFIGQDQEYVNRTLKVLHDYVENQQAAVILVSHYLDPLFNLADRLIFFDKGRILFDVPMSAGLAELRKFDRTEYLPDYCT